MELSIEARRALERIGSEIADVRPDLNGKITDRFIIEAAIFHLLGTFYDTRPEPERLTESMSISLVTAHDVNNDWRLKE